MLLEVSGLTTRYGSISALRDVEQNAARMLEVADRAYGLRSGAVVAHGSGAEVLAQTDLFDTFVRGSAS